MWSPNLADSATVFFGGELRAEQALDLGRVGRTRCGWPWARAHLCPRENACARWRTGPGLLCADKSHLQSPPKLVDGQLRTFAPLLRALEVRAGEADATELDFEATLALWRLQNGRAVMRFLEDVAGSAPRGADSSVD